MLNELCDKLDGVTYECVREGDMDAAIRVLRDEVGRSMDCLEEEVMQHQVRAHTVDLLIAEWKVFTYLLDCNE